MKNNEVKFIIFDYDGVLVDSVSINIKCFVEALSNLGYKVQVNDFVIGESLEKQFQRLVEKYNIESDFSEFEEEFERLKSNKKELIKFRSNFKELILELKDNFDLGVLSNNSQDNIKKTLSDNKVLVYFDKITGNQRVNGEGPDKKTRLKEMMNDLSHTPQESVFIDDVPGHIKIAHEVGLKTISFIYEENEHMDFPDYACRAASASDIKGCIKRFL